MRSTIINILAFIWSIWFLILAVLNTISLVEKIKYFFSHMTNQSNSLKIAYLTGNLLGILKIAFYLFASMVLLYHLFIKNII